MTTHELQSAHTPRLSTSTWSLHRALGRPEGYGPDGSIDAATHGRGALSLLELPSRLAEFGINTLEICHFHLPSREASYLQELRAALEAAEVELFSLLIDGGDITHPTHGERDLAWIGNWLEVAASLGSRCVRVIAGKAAPDATTLHKSREGLNQLATRAAAYDLRLMTENWFDLLARPREVLELLDDMEGRLGLCLDFGNWGGATKYSDLAAIAARAESCHTKAEFPAPREMDVEDYRKCLDITRAGGFSGPYTLIYSGPNENEWEGLAMERAVVADYLG